MKKNYKKFCYFVYILFIFLIAILIILGITKKLKNYIELVSITISLFAVIISILESKQNQILNLEIENRKFLASFLQDKKRKVDELLVKIIKEMQQENSIDPNFEIELADQLLAQPVCEKLLTSFYYTYKEIVQLYVPIIQYKIKNMTKEDREDRLYKMNRNVIQLRVNFNIQISKIISQIYNGEIKLNQIEKIEGDTQWIN